MVPAPKYRMGIVTKETGFVPDRNIVEPPASKVFTDDLQRWHAVETRDKAADGAFVYAVTTTGIYCRPSCSSQGRNEKSVLRR